MQLPQSDDVCFTRFSICICWVLPEFHNKAQQHRGIMIMFFCPNRDPTPKTSNISCTEKPCLCVCIILVGKWSICCYSLKRTYVENICKQHTYAITQAEVSIGWLGSVWKHCVLCLELFWSSVRHKVRRASWILQIVAVGFPVMPSHFVLDASISVSSHCWAPIF